MVPELKAHLEALAAQTKSGPASSSSPRPIPTAQPALEGEEEDIVLEIKDLDAGKIITLKSRDVVASSDVVNRKSQSTSPPSPSISEFMVVRNLDVQPHTPPPLQPQPRSRISELKLLPPSPMRLQLHLPASDPIQSRQPSPVTPLTEAVYVNHSLERSLSKLEHVLYSARKSHNKSPSVSTSLSSLSSQSDGPLGGRAMHFSKTSSHASSIFSSRVTNSPFSTPPASPPPIRSKPKPVSLPCAVCGRPMQRMTSTQCGHVFCRGCIEGRSVCPVCKTSTQDRDLRAIYLFV